MNKGEIMAKRKSQDSSKNDTDPDGKLLKPWILVDSDINLPQCKEGIQYLQDHVRNYEIDRFMVETVSVHNINYVLDVLHKITHTSVDVLIVGTGGANSLAGICDAYLRYSMENRHIVVFGVAFHDLNKPENIRAKTYSIENIYNTQVVFHNYIGSEGFKRACIDAVEGELPEIVVPDPEPMQCRSFEDTLAFIDSQPEK